MKKADEKEVGPTPCLGYSKAHRPDLKQVVLSMVQMGPAHIPVWMEDLSGKNHHQTSSLSRQSCMVQISFAIRRWGYVQQRRRNPVWSQDHGLNHRQQREPP